jgi:adenosylcobyric acid synthase
LLVANIDCGGVFAQVVGTKACCSERDWSLCVGVVVNKLRGDPKFFEPGPRILEQMVGKPVFVVPYLDDLNLPEEDGMGIERRLAWEKRPSMSYPHNKGQSSTTSDKQEKKPVVVVVAYPHTAIADDLCPLEQDPRFEVEWRRKLVPKPFPHTTAVVLPGSRLTLADLKWMNDLGWITFIRKHVAAGGCVLGLCGGYQMLGWQVDDPDAVEGRGCTRQGIGLLPIKTTIAPVSCKVVKPRSGQLFPSGIQVEGFELHCGQSEVLSAEVSLLGKNSEISPLLSLSNGKPEGMQLGRVRGTYLHGILRSEKARVELLVPNKNDFPLLKTRIPVVDPLDKFANHVSSCGLDSNTLSRLVGL